MQCSHLAGSETEIRGFASINSYTTLSCSKPPFMPHSTHILVVLCHWPCLTYVTTVVVSSMCSLSLFHLWKLVCDYIKCLKNVDKVILLRKKRVRHFLSLEVKLEVPYLKPIEKGERNVDIQRVMGLSQLIGLFNQKWIKKGHHSKKCSVYSMYYKTSPTIRVYVLSGKAPECDYTVFVYWEISVILVSFCLEQDKHLKSVKIY